MLKFDIDTGLITLAKQIRKAGFKKQANKILKLSDKSKQTVQILEDSFKELGPFLSREKANNLSMAVLYYDSGDDLETYIHDSLLKTNESYYDAERKNKISDQKAWAMAEKAIKKLQQKRIIPQDLN